MSGLDTLRLKLLLAYDGTTFHGFAPQKEHETVGGALIGAFEKLTKIEVDLTCAGRTDKGVHALGQVVHFDLPAELLGEDPVETLNRWKKSLNSQLYPRISIFDISLCDSEFNARRDALSRTYRYLIREGPNFVPWEKNTVWHVGQYLDRSLLDLGITPLVGEHDFSSFCRKPPDKEGSLVRKVLECRFEEHSGLLEFTITSTSFCHQMVRSIVGLLVEVGKGKVKPSQVKSILEARDRSASLPLAPPSGLCLIKVRYDRNLP